MLPATVYGAAVYGMDDKELKKLRSSMLAAKKPNVGGSSATMQLAVKGADSWAAALAPARMWCRLLWNAQTTQHDPTPGLPNTRHIAKCWEAVHSYDLAALS